MDDAQIEEREPQTYSAYDSEEVEHIVDDRIVSIQENRAAQQRKMEYIKFGILAAILLGIVFVLAIAQPLVFGRVVPGVMGVRQTNAGLEGNKPEMEEMAPESGAEQPDTSDPEQGGGAPGVAEPSAGEEASGEQAEQATAQIYVVQSGDTLNSIARQFNTTVEAIVAANNIQDPDNLLVGTPLTIPQP
jgi:nucleoid-associated protein YgaU